MSSDHLASRRQALSEKFNNAAAEVLYEWVLDGGGGDASIGSIDEGGAYELFVLNGLEGEELDPSDPDAAILYEDVHGYVYAWLYPTMNEAYARWAEIEADYYPDGYPD